MNNTLDFTRLMRLMRKHWTENFAFYSMAALALFGLLATMLTIWVVGSGRYYSEEPLYVIFFTGLFLSGCIFASSAFGMLGDKAKGGFWLSLPASHLEKLITTIFFTTIVFFAVYGACFLILKPLAIAYINSKIADGSASHFQRIVWQKGDDGFKVVFEVFLYGFFALQSLYLMGSAFFNKHAFIKTTITAAAIIFLLVFYTYKMGTWMIPNDIHAGNVMGPTDNQKDILVWVAKLIWAPMFWVITWFRLKETEL